MPSKPCGDWDTGSVRAMRIKVQWKLTFVFYCAVFLAVSAGYGRLVSHLRANVQSDFENNVRRQLLLGRSLLESRLRADGGRQEFQKIARDIGDPLALRVTIIDKSGEVRGDTDLSDEQVRVVGNHADRPEVKAALLSGFGMSNRFSGTLGKTMLYMAVPFRGASGVLRFSVPLREIEAFQSRARNVAGEGILGILLISLLFTFLLSFLISRPLRKMSSVAEGMARGDFSRKLFMHSRDEIEDLARALNSLSDQVREKIDSLSAERAKLDLVLSSMFEGVIATDAQERIILMNPSLRRLFMVSVDPEGRKPLEVIRNSTIGGMVDRILKGQQLATEEVTVSVPEERVVQVNGVPIVRNGITEGTILVFHDITELRRLEKVRREFVANVSHELRTPISSIKGYAETLLEGAIDDKDNAREFLSIIVQDANRLAALINDLLDLSKIESGKMAVSFSPLDPGQMLKKAVQVMERQAAAKAVSVACIVPQGLPPVLADETMFLQVMINLLDNAIKYTPEKGSVTVSAVISGGFLQVDVSDNGMGIPEQDLSRVFERFYRVDKARSRELGGTGLGLSIVKHIVEIHHGRVWVKSGPGTGSVFSFTIPLA